jgi:hypothetical protein
MTVGERYYGVLDNEDECQKRLDALKLSWVGVTDLNGTWVPLTAGIPPEFYTSVEYEGLPARYEIRQCIEVFPAPDAEYVLRVKGHFGLGRLVDDLDQCTIDSELLFLWALANAKNHYGQPDAADVAAQAQTYLKELVAASHGTRRYIPGAQPVATPPRPVLVVD